MMTTHTHTRTRRRNPDGNARLTGILASAILPLFIVAFITALRAKNGMLSIHVAIGLLVAIPIAAKLSSVTYRLAGYYRGIRPYRERGRPSNSLRMLGASLGVLVILLLGSGLVLLVGPRSAHSAALTVHKASGYLSMATLIAHLVVHLPESVRLGTADLRRRAPRIRGALARWSAVATSLALGSVLVVLLSGNSASYVKHYLSHQSSAQGSTQHPTDSHSRRSAS